MQDHPVLCALRSQGKRHQEDAGKHLRHQRNSATKSCASTVVCGFTPTRTPPLRWSLRRPAAIWTRNSMGGKPLSARDFQRKKGPARQPVTGRLAGPLRRRKTLRPHQHRCRCKERFVRLFACAYLNSRVVCPLLRPSPAQDARVGEFAPHHVLQRPAAVVAVDDHDLADGLVRPREQQFKLPLLPRPRACRGCLLRWSSRIFVPAWSVSFVRSFVGMGNP